MKNQVASQDDAEESKQVAIAQDPDKALDQIEAEDIGRMAALPPLAPEPIRQE